MTYAIGTWGMAVSTSGIGLQLTAGVLVGLGVAFTSFSIALAAMVRVVPTDRQSLVLGIGTASGSLGQVIFSPISQQFITAYGWQSTLYILAASALIILPLALLLPGQDQSGGDGIEQSVREAISEAISHRGYVLLTTGFFVCGFHVAFITVHFPAYVGDLGLPAIVGAKCNRAHRAVQHCRCIPVGARRAALHQETPFGDDLSDSGHCDFSTDARRQNAIDDLYVRSDDGHPVAVDGYP